MTAPVRTLFFAGPSLSAAARDVLDSAPGVRLLPPVRRGDLARALAEEPSARLLVVVDGEFFQSLAVTPRELMAVLESGRSVVGAASMGALRAVELRRHGMVGVGRVYDLYARRRIWSDDEVAVSVDPGSQRALTTSLVSVRCALAALVARGELDAGAAVEHVRAVAAQHFTERTLAHLVRLAPHRRAGDLLREHLEQQLNDVKAADALAAARWARDRTGQRTTDPDQDQEARG
jgi:hypothetical protein